MSKGWEEDCECLLENRGILAINSYAKVGLNMSVSGKFSFFPLIVMLGWIRSLHAKDAIN